MALMLTPKWLTSASRLCLPSLGSSRRATRRVSRWAWGSGASVTRVAWKSRKLRSKGALWEIKGESPQKARNCGRTWEKRGAEATMASEMPWMRWTK
ncbi:hypothetical protein D3C87_1583880 [compost metagenome]